MRTCCYFILLSVFSLLWAGCDTFPQTVNAQPASRMEAVPQTDRSQVEVANLKADIQALDRRVREINMAMEELSRRNRELSAELEQVKRQNSRPDDMVRQPQLDRAISDLQQKTRDAGSEQRRQIIREVTQQIEALGAQTQAAMDALAKNISSRPAGAAPRTTFSEDFPKEGISYTVKSGDTLSGIASRNNSTVRDIQNANQISNPASIQVGQTLFIPQKSN